MPVAERGTISTTWAHQKWRRASHRRWSGEKKRADNINKALISLRKLEGNQEGITRWAEKTLIQELERSHIGRKGG